MTDRDQALHLLREYVCHPCPETMQPLRDLLMHLGSTFPAAIVFYPECAWAHNKPVRAMVACRKCVYTLPSQGFKCCCKLHTYIDDIKTGWVYEMTAAEIHLAAVNLLALLT